MTYLNPFNFVLTIYTKLIARKFAYFGKNSFIGPILNSTNEKYISIGDEVGIGTFCRITVATEYAGVKCKSENPIRLRIGNRVSIGHNTFISVNNSVEIGNDVLMSCYVFITDHDHGFYNIEQDILKQPLTEDGHTKIGSHVFLGVKSSILKNVTIGEHSVVGANSVVTRDVPPYSIVAGNPARVVKQYNFDKKEWITIPS